MNVKTFLPGNIWNKRLNWLLLGILAATLQASAQSVDDAQNQFKDKILMLRHPLRSNYQEYGSDGKVLSGTAEGPWTVYGGVQIDKVKRNADGLRIEGRRTLFVFPQGRLTPMKFQILKNRIQPPFQPEMKLELHLDSAPNSAEGVHTALARIFFMNTSDLLAGLPEFWRAFLRDRLAYDPTATPTAEFGWHEPQPKQSGPVPWTAGVALRTDPDENIQTVYHVGSEVKPPRATYVPEPDFTDAARYEKFQGTVVLSLVVAKDGSVHQVHLIRPLGMGLDEQAEARLHTWKFSPATRNGQPVAVEMNAEVSFNLY
jgi:TonB family protein